MSLHVTTNETCNDIALIVLENDRLRVEIMPELGAKIWQIVYKPRNRYLLWNNPTEGMAPRAVPFGSNYEDNFFGGWDELYPNDMPERLNGLDEPDHGELWSLPWQYEFEQVNSQEITVRLWVETKVCASRMEKWVTLREGESKLHFRHRLTNTGDRAIPFLWKLHTALAIDDPCRIDLGAKTMYFDDYGVPRTGRNLVSYEWPYAKDDSGKTHDMRDTLPSGSRIKEFQYATEMREGWCALTHKGDGVGIGLVFDLEAMPNCWVYASYGAWKDVETVILEPCSGYPMYVRDGIAQGTHRSLQAGEVIECEVLAVVYEGIAGIRSIDRLGNITEESKSEQEAY